jgi:hypothetical protein
MTNRMTLGPLSLRERGFILFLSGPVFPIAGFTDENISGHRHNLLRTLDLPVTVKER